MIASLAEEAALKNNIEKLFKLLNAISKLGCDRVRPVNSQKRKCQ